MRNASSNRPFTQCQDRVPKAEGPEEDGDEVLYPAMERRKTGSSRRNMGGCCVVEDADQNVDRDEKPRPAEKKGYICSSSPICGTPRGVTGRHLSSPPVWALRSGGDEVTGSEACARTLARRKSTWVDDDRYRHHGVHLPSVKVGCQRLSGQTRTEMMY